MTRRERRFWGAFWRGVTQASAILVPPTLAAAFLFWWLS